MGEEKTNMQKLLAVKGISTRAVQSVIHAASEKTAYNKIHRLTDWTYPEAMAVKEAFFPEYAIEYVFAGYDRILV